MIHRAIGVGVVFVSPVGRGPTIDGKPTLRVGITETGRLRVVDRPANRTDQFLHEQIKVILHLRTSVGGAAMGMGGIHDKGMRLQFVFFTYSLFNRRAQLRSNANEIQRDKNNARPVLPLDGQSFTEEILILACCGSFAGGITGHRHGFLRSDNNGGHPNLPGGFLFSKSRSQSDGDQRQHNGDFHGVFWV